MMSASTAEQSLSRSAEQRRRMGVDLTTDVDRARSLIGDHQSIRRGGHQRDGTRRIVTTTPRACTSPDRVMCTPFRVVQCRVSSSSNVVRWKTSPVCILEVGSNEPLEQLQLAELSDQEILGHRIEVGRARPVSRTVIADDAVVHDVERRGGRGCSDEVVVVPLARRPSPGCRPGRRRGWRCARRGHRPSPRTASTCGSSISCTAMKFAR